MKVRLSKKMPSTQLLDFLGEKLGSDESGIFLLNLNFTFDHPKIYISLVDNCVVKKTLLH